ncbi:MAG: uroporphyrinogen decarboxylase family protein, partial [Ignavibacteria bacterium]|nr:uroporphyrinogen decarboxylase family protein [Ignavibacteria bacterium]
RLAQYKNIIAAFNNAGYDYATISGWRTNILKFLKGESKKKESVSLNAGSVITDRESFEKYLWPNADEGDYDIYIDLKKHLPDGMKLIASGNGGVLENIIDLVGFENLCLMCLIDEELTTEIFDEVGSRFLRFYEILAPIETIGACIVNDDWGFKNQTILSPEMLRRWVFPWHKKIVETIHKSGKYAILHSCGQVKNVMSDIIYDMRYDAKHSFEDLITPVEDAYELWSSEIAILGGIDLDFLARSSTSDITRRSVAMLERTSARGGYALGSGNSIPNYIPDENYFAMISTVNM